MLNNEKKIFFGIVSSMTLNHRLKNCLSRFTFYCLTWPRRSVDRENDFKRVLLNEKNEAFCFRIQSEIRNDFLLFSEYWEYQFVIVNPDKVLVKLSSRERGSISIWDLEIHRIVEFHPKTNLSEPKERLSWRIQSKSFTSFCFSVKLRLGAVLLCKPYSKRIVSFSSTSKLFLNEIESIFP